MEVEGLVSSLNIVNEDFLKENRILELENRKVRLELGTRKDTQTNKNCDTSAVWETFSIITGDLMTGEDGTKREVINPSENLEGWVRS